MKKILFFAIFSLALTAAKAQQGETPQTEPFTPSSQTSPEYLWNEANSAYINGDFAKAADLYGRIAAEGLQSAELWYNYANACFRTGDNAHAILYYNRALLLSPSDEDIRHNLAIAESLTKDHIEEVPEFVLNVWMRTVRNSLDERVWTLLSVLLFALALAGGLLFLLGQRTAARKGGFYAMTAALLLCIAATAFAASQRTAVKAREGAIVMSSAAPVKSHPDRSATDLFVLHEGTKVRVVETLDRWSEIVIADGNKGWIESDKIERI